MKYDAGIYVKCQCDYPEHYARDNDVLMSAMVDSRGAIEREVQLYCFTQMVENMAIGIPYGYKMHLYEGPQDTVLQPKYWDGETVLVISRVQVRQVKEVKK